jgi:hypothetical protein
LAPELLNILHGQIWTQEPVKTEAGPQVTLTAKLSVILCEAIQSEPYFEHIKKQRELYKVDEILNDFKQ